jgi:hypothetical protein
MLNPKEQHDAEQGLPTKQEPAFGDSRRVTELMSRLKPGKRFVDARSLQGNWAGLANEADDAHQA